MKVLHLCTGQPITYNGGITNYVRSLAEMQAKKGYDVVVVGGKDPKATDLPFKYVQYYDFYVKPYTLRENKSIFAYKKIEKIIKNEKPDLVHIHMILDADERLYKILHKYKIKYLVSLHDYTFLCPKIQMFRDNHPCENVSENCKYCAHFLEQRFFLKKISDILKINKKIGKKYSPKFLTMYEYNKKLLEGANLLLPVSNRVKEIYAKSDIKNDYKVLHIGNITANSFKNYEIKKQKDKSKIKVLMLGNFSNIKGGNEFIKIANKLNDKFEFYFLGRSSNEEKEKMKNNNIIDKGEYKQKDLPELLKEYDFGCVLSIWEDNGPQVVMELLNNNIPVIGTKMGGIPDFIRDEENGFLYNPYSNESFDNLIKKLNNLTFEDCENMKNRVKRTLTPEEHFEELDKEYKEILGSNN